MFGRKKKRRDTKKGSLRTPKHVPTTTGYVNMCVYLLFLYLFMNVFILKCVTIRGSTDEQEVKSEPSRVVRAAVRNAAPVAVTGKRSNV